MASSPSDKRHRLEAGANGKTRRSHRIALCVIAGDNCFEDGIETMLRSCVGKVGAVYISFNGEDQGVFESLGSAVHDIFGDIPGEMATFEWQDDFALARNHSFSLAKDNANGPKFDAEWLVWLDCDDELPPNFSFDACIDELNKRHAHGGFVRYVYYSDAHGELAGHYKDRIFRADVNWQWIFPIHEVTTGPIATRMIKLPFDEFGGVIHKRRDEEVSNKRARNRRIIARWFKQEPDNPRVQLMMAHETFEEAVQSEDKKIAEAALSLYQKFIDKMDPDDDAYIANLYVGRIYRMLGKAQSAINIFLQGIKLMPKWPACYVEIAETYLSIGYYELAVQWAQTCYRATEVPEDTYVPIEPLDQSYRPMMIEGTAQLALENYDEALKAFQRAYQIRGDEFTKSRIGDVVTARDAHLVETEVDITDQRELLWGTVGPSGKSVAFFTRPHFETWNTDTLEADGLGGTETCVIRLAQKLNARGWRVVIFGTPPSEGTDREGIEWYNSQRWHPDEPFTATVAVRFPELFDAAVKSDVKVLWTHDVNMGDVRWGDGEDRFSNPDVIVSPSPWATMHLGAVYELEERGDSDLHVIFNGFDVDMFDSRVSENITQIRNPQRLVYASSPDRGLDRLLDFWPAIRERYPKAELHVYYGWEGIDKIIESGSPVGPQLAHFKKTMEAKLDRLGRERVGIIWHGRVKQDVLAAAMKSAWVMPYPANFCETFGIVFAQGMAAGCLPVTCDLGALPMLINDRRLVVSGAAPDSEVYERLFLDKLYSVMDMGQAERHELSMELNEKVKSLNYDQVADSWEDLFQIYIERHNPVKVITSGA